MSGFNLSKNKWLLTIKWRYFFRLERVCGMFVLGFILGKMCIEFYGKKGLVLKVGK